MRDGEDTNTVEEAVIEQGSEIDEQQEAADDRGSPVTVEDIASRLGWSPKEKWRGNADEWRSAEEFLEHTVGETRSLRKTVKSLKDGMDRMTRAQEAVIERALDAQKKQLEAKFDQAVEDGDAKAARDAQKELDALEKKQGAGPSSDVRDFVSRNSSWFEKHPRATKLAIEVTNELAADGKSEAEQLEEAEKEVKKRFPELFDEEQAPAKKAAPGVSQPGSRAVNARSRKNSFDDLPAEAKAAWANFDRDFKRRGFEKGYPKEEYAKEYFRDQAA